MTCCIRHVTSLVFAHGHRPLNLISRHFAFATRGRMPSVQTPQELLAEIKQFIPPMLETMHKGQHGRVAVIGGSEDYTGAPFFSANASALLGADMSHVICEPQAAQVTLPTIHRPPYLYPHDVCEMGCFCIAYKFIVQVLFCMVIKTYSPNLMVHPYMRQSCNREKGMETVDEVSSKIVDMLGRLHAIVIGPGLGRDPLMLQTAARVIEEAKKKGMPIVVDADGLFLVQNQPSIVHSYAHAILTPNKAEFARLCKAMGIEKSDEGKGACSRLAKAFGGVTIIQKGPNDYISNGEQTITCDIRGGLKRSGGQGDTLTGCLVTFLAWKKAYQDRLWDHNNSLSDSKLISLSAYGAAAITRNCSRLAFEKKGRSMQALDLSAEVGSAFKNLFESEEPEL